MKIDCLFVANDPGSFNVLFPVIKEVFNTSLRFLCYIVEFGKEDLIRNSIPFKVLNESFNNSKIRRLLKDCQPSVVVTGNSWEHSYLGKTECRFIQEAEALQIYSICIPDFWSNYRRRFSISQGKTLDALPNLICAIDASMGKALVDAGIPKDRILITGSPYFDRLININNLITQQGKSHFRTKFEFQDDEIIIVFLSQPIKEDFKEGKFRFDEETILKDVLRAVKSQKWFKKARVIWKPHPREENKNIKEQFSNSILAFSEFNVGNIFELMAGADLIIGAFTMLLIESFLLNFPCVSYQPNEKTYLELPYNIKILKSYDSLNQFLTTQKFRRTQRNQAAKLILAKKSSNEIKNLILSHAKY